MTALAAALKLNLGSKSAPNLLPLPANSVTCLQNGLIGFRPSTGYAVNWNGTAGDIPVGFADKNRASATTLWVDDSKNGKVLTGTADATGFPIAGLTSQALCPAFVYCSTDNIGADLTLTPTGPAVAVAVMCVSSGYGWIVPLFTGLALYEKMDLHNAQTIAGVKTFSDTPKMDAIAEKTATVGVLVDSVRLRDGMVQQQQAVPTAETGVATLTLAKLLTKIITFTGSSGNIALTLDTGANMDAGLAIAAGESFDWSLINLSGTPGTNTATVTASSGHTIVGEAVVGDAAVGANSALFRTKKVSANTFVTYRIG